MMVAIVGDGVQLVFDGQSLVCTTRYYLNSNKKTNMSTEAADTWTTAPTKLNEMHGGPQGVPNSVQWHVGLDCRLHCVSFELGKNMGAFEKRKLYMLVIHVIVAENDTINKAARFEI